MTITIDLQKSKIAFNIESQRKENDYNKFLVKITTRIFSPMSTKIFNTRDSIFKGFLNIKLEIIL